jgi:hypothetical protein
MECSIQVAPAATDMLGRLSDEALAQLQERLLVAARLTPLRSPTRVTSFWVTADGVTAFCGLDFGKRALVVYELFPCPPAGARAATPAPGSGAAAR